MDVVAEILAARGDARCGYSAGGAGVGLAAEFGLAPDADRYREIDAATARRLIELVLHRDLAYRYELMPAARAVDLADRFLAPFGTDGVRYFTNAMFDEKAEPMFTLSSFGWNPVTAATFDTGVLVVGPRRCGCLWVEDED
ncbi:MAG: hypothetical protein U0804_06150 [Gemmataceae bacterium]